MLDLADLRTTLKFLSSDEGKPVLEEYGGVSKASVGVLLRSLVELEEAGAGEFFGEPEFDVADLLRITPEGKGVVSLLEISDVMDRPRLFTTFMLWMLAQVYAELPEEGDLPKPKLAFFFDEAHLLFDDASEALLDQIELTARLIRSKGVGVYFVTQSPTDVPSSVLSQLGNRVQHALRAFTPDDETALNKTVKTFPKTRALRRRGHAHLARDRRGARHGADPQGGADPTRGHAARAARFADGCGGRGVPRARCWPMARWERSTSQAVDRESAHEMISARLGTAKEAAGVDLRHRPGPCPCPLHLPARRRPHRRRHRSPGRRPSHRSPRPPRVPSPRMATGWATR